MFRDRECRRVTPLLWDHAVGQLQEQAREKVETHLARCAACRQEVASMAQTAGLVAAERARPVSAPSPAWEELANRLNAAPRRRPVRAWPVWTIAWSAAVVAAALLLWMARSAGHQPALFSPHTQEVAVHPIRPLPGSPQHAGQPSPHPMPPEERAPRQNPPGLNPLRPIVHAPRSAPSQTPDRAVAPDTDYLDGRADPLTSLWMGQSAENVDVVKDGGNAFADRSIAGLSDDFIRVPLPTIAGTGPSSVAAARHTQQEQAKLVDTRLFRKVTLALKGVSLEELCALLQKQIGVTLRSSRDVREEKTTVFVQDLPARDVMHGVARLFGYYWIRTGEEGAFTYELAQDLRARLREEDLRSRDLNAALLALEDTMRQRASTITRQNEPSLWAIYQFYQRLSIADRAALRNGEELIFRSDSANPDRRFPDDLRSALLQGIAPYKVLPSGELSSEPTAKGTPVADIRQASCAIKFLLGHTELGHITLQMAAGFSYPLPDGRQAGMTGGEQGWGNPLVSAQSPAIASPNNARENAALRQAPALQHLVSLRPKSSCPRLKQGNPSGESEDRGATQEEFEAANHPIPTPHITSADAWEEVHKQTGLPIVADYYTRLYPVSAATVSNAPLFEALSKVTDALGIRWTQDGGLLLGRSTSWYWDKLKEPSNTLLDSLQAYGRGGADLPFEALFQIAALSDAQLDSERVAQGIQHCRELDAWSLVTANTGGWRDFYVMRRAILRALSTSSPEQRETLQSPTGLAFNALGPGQQQGLIAALHTMNFLPSTLLGSHIRLEYVPSGRYVWRPRRALAPHDNGERLPLVTGRTLQEALTNARLVDAAATEANIARTRGILALTVFAGNDMAWSWGRPMPH